LGSPPLRKVATVTTAAPAGSAEPGLFPRGAIQRRIPPMLRMYLAYVAIILGLSLWALKYLTGL